MQSPSIQARNALGGAVRRGNANQIAEARRNLAAAKLETYVARVVADAPPLSDTQKNRIASLLGGGAG